MISLANNWVAVAALLVCIGAAFLATSKGW